MRLPQAFHAENQAQLDLIVFKYGLLAEFDEVANGWVSLTLRAPRVKVEE
jgi:hypothetical protein